MLHLLMYQFYQNTILLTLESKSRQLLPLTNIPFLLDTPIPVKYESGTEIAIAHGQDITKNTSAL